MNTNTILQIYGTNYTEMTRELLKEAELDTRIQEKAAALGRSSASAGRKMRIGIKPNLVTPSPAMFGATTHPEIIAGIIEYLQDHGYDAITICEGSWVGDKTQEAFDYCGYRDLADTCHVTLLDTQKDNSQKVDAAGMQLQICRCLADIDFLINVPVLKGHCQTKMTCALKNMKGLIPNAEKRRFHSLGLHKPIAHLNAAIRQDFIVVDHICGDPDFEEGGNPLVRNCIMAAADPVLTDALACRILGYRPQDVDYVMLAEQLGVGHADLSNLTLITLQNPADSTNPAIPGHENIPGDSAPFADPAAAMHKMLELNYAVEEIDSCSACYSALIGALDRLHQDGLLRRLTEEQKIRFCIGQGYRNPEKAKEHAASSVINPQDGITRIGIGNCTRSFAHFIPGCPPTEDAIEEVLRKILSGSEILSSAPAEDAIEEVLP